MDVLSILIAEGMFPNFDTLIYHLVHECTFIENNQLVLQARKDYVTY